MKSRLHLVRQSTAGGGLPMRIYVTRMGMGIKIEPTGVMTCHGWHTALL
jgi:hypothetical protein